MRCMRTSGTASRAVWLVLAVLLATGCSDEDNAPVTPTDTTAPETISDLRINSVSDHFVTLAWTAPGDDGDAGTATGYDLRYSGTAIDEDSWAAATPATTEPSPAVAGTEQYAIVEVAGDGVFHFAIRTTDEAANWSGLSNDVFTLVGSLSFQVRQLTNEGPNFHPSVSDGHVAWVGMSSATGREIYSANLEVAFPAPTRLTDNGGEKEHPTNHGSERIVWQGREGPSADWEIWIYDMYATPRFRALTDNELPDIRPDLAGAGNFCWLQGPPMYEEVRYWNESASTSSVISDGCCSTDQWSNETPSADDGAVVWRSYDRTHAFGHRVHLWDGTTTDLSATLDAEMTSNHSLCAGTIAYHYGGGGSTQIRYWDGASVHEIGEGFHPSLSNGAIAFEVWDGHDWEIHYWDGMTVHEITDNDYNDTQPSLHGTWIAWVGRPESLDQIFFASVAQ